jgi:hypothetical protein
MKLQFFAMSLLTLTYCLTSKAAKPDIDTEYVKPKLKIASSFSDGTTVEMVGAIIQIVDKRSGVACYVPVGASSLQIICPQK